MLPAYWLPLRRPLACRHLLRFASPGLVDQVKGMVDHGRSLVPAEIIEIGQCRLKMAPCRLRPFHMLNTHLFLLAGAEESLGGSSPRNNRKIIDTG